MATASERWLELVQAMDAIRAPDPDRSVGILCDFVPPELIHAAGLAPVRLMGHADPHAVSLGTTYLQRNACPFVRGCMGQIAQKRFSDYYGLVLSHTCDSMRGLAENVRYFHLHPGLIYFLDVPRKATTRSALTYYLTQLRELKIAMETDLSITISEQNLTASTRLYNDLRGQLRELRRHLARPGSAISMTHFHDVLSVAVTRDPECLMPLLAELVHSLDLSPEPPGHQPVRLMLTGSLLPHRNRSAEEGRGDKLLGVIEDLGGRVVDAILCAGSRFHETMVETGEDMLERLASACFQRTSSSWMFPHDGRDAELLKRITSQDVQGVIHYTLKFCDPLQYDTPRIKRMCAGAGVPFLALETEMTEFDRGQTTTRIQAFMEGIRR